MSGGKKTSEISNRLPTPVRIVVDTRLRDKIGNPTLTTDGVLKDVDLKTGIGGSYSFGDLFEDTGPLFGSVKDSLDFTNMRLWSHDVESVTALPPHGKDFRDFIRENADSFSGGKVLIISVDQLKLDGSVHGDVESLGSLPQGSNVAPHSEAVSAIELGEKLVVLGFDHHNAVPEGDRGLVGSELVLKHVGVITETVWRAINNGYSIVVVGHGAPYDPDSMIGQYLVKQVVAGQGLFGPEHEGLGRYARSTDYYTFPFGEGQHLSLRGIADGIGILMKGLPHLMAKASDMVLDLFIKNERDPNDRDAFGGFVQGIAETVEQVVGTAEAIIRDSVLKKLENLQLARELITNSRTFEAELETVLSDGTVTKQAYRVVLVENKGAAFKEIDDVLYDPLRGPTVIIKQDNAGKWWVSMRPQRYNNGGQFVLDPQLYSAKDPKNHVAGFKEQIVMKLVQGLPEGKWPDFWPFSAVAQQSEVPIEGGKLVSVLFPEAIEITPSSGSFKAIAP